MIGMQGKKEPFPSQVMGAYHVHTQGLSLKCEISGNQQVKGLTLVFLSLSFSGRIWGVSFRAALLLFSHPLALCSLLMWPPFVSFISDPISPLLAYSFSLSALPVESVPFRSCSATVCVWEKFSSTNNHVSAVMSDCVIVRSIMGSCSWVRCICLTNSCHQEGRVTWYKVWELSNRSRELLTHSKGFGVDR